MRDAVGSAAITTPAEEQPRGRFLIDRIAAAPQLRVAGIPVVAAGLACILLAILEPGFFRAANLHVLMQQCSVLGIVTLGQLLVLLVGGIDLSVGAVMNATLITIAVMNRHQPHLAASIVLSLLLGSGVGLVNGLLVSLRDVPPFAATLGMLACVQGAILVYTKGIPAGNIPSSLRPVALDGVGIVPYSLIICIAIGLVLLIVLRRGTYGRKIYAVGRSPGLPAGSRSRRRTSASRPTCSAVCLPRWPGSSSVPTSVMSTPR